MNNIEFESLLLKNCLNHILSLDSQHFSLDIDSTIMYIEPLLAFVEVMRTFDEIPISGINVYYDNDGYMCLMICFRDIRRILYTFHVSYVNFKFYRNESIVDGDISKFDGHIMWKKIIHLN